MNYTNLEELCLLSCDRPFEVITGNDAEILPALELGCPGAIVALANPYPELCVEICERFRAGDRETAWMIQKLLVRVRNACRATVPVVSHKYLLELRGIPAGAAHFPMRELTEAEKSLLRSAAEAAQAVLSTCCSLAQPNKII